MFQDLPDPFDRLCLLEQNVEFLVNYVNQLRQEQRQFSQETVKRVHALESKCQQLELELLFATVLRDHNGKREPLRKSV